MTEEMIMEATPRIISRGERERVNVLGILCEWKLTPEETGQRYGAIEILVPPGAGIPLHSHAAHEAFYLLEGQADFGRMGSQGPEWLAAVPGDTYDIPGNTMHGFRNAGTSMARMLVLFGADLAGFFEEAGVPRRSGRGRWPADGGRDRARLGDHAQVRDALPRTDDSLADPGSGNSPLTGSGWPFVENPVTSSRAASIVRHALPLLRFHRDRRRNSECG